MIGCFRTGNGGTLCSDCIRSGCPYRTRRGKIPPLRILAAACLKVPEAEIAAARIARRSVDARDRRDVHFTLSLDVRLASPKLEETLLKRFQPNQVARIDKPNERDIFHLPVAPYPTDRPRPVVIGAGPAGAVLRAGPCCAWRTADRAGAWQARERTHGGYRHADAVWRPQSRKQRAVRRGAAPGRFLTAS